jgi:hypothetical protein
MSCQSSVKQHHQIAMTILYLFLQNIPATPQKPFQVLVKGKIQFESTSDIDNGRVDIDVPDSGFASFIKVHINFLVPELGIDELNQYNITNNGPYFLVSVLNGRLDVKQRFDERFSATDAAVTQDDSNKFYQDSETGEFVYSYNKPKYMTDGRNLKDPNYYKKEAPTKTLEEANNSANLSVNSTRCYLHLAGIDATQQDPFVLKVDGRVIFKSSRPIAKPAKIPVFIKQPIVAARYHEITMRIEMPELGVETDHDFNLTLGGVHIQIAVINNIVEILQNKNGIFPMLTKIDSRYAQKEYTPLKDEKISDVPELGGSSTTTTVTQSGGEGDEVEVSFFMRNIPASKNEPFQLLVNGEELFSTVNNLPKDRVTIAKCALPAVQGADQILEARFKIVAKGVDAVQQFNLTRNGRNILVEIADDGKGGEKVNMKQQHKDTWSTSQQGVQKPTGIAENTEVLFFLDGLSASKVKPFSLYVNDQKIFEVTDSLESGKIVVVNGQLPRPKTGDHIIRVKALVPDINVEEVRDVNLTAGGAFIKFEQVGREVNVYQSTSDNFGGEPLSRGGSSAAKSSTGGIDVLEQLEKLASLKDKGILSEAEFNLKKKQLLGL